MRELLELLATPWNFLWVLLVFGFAPGFCLRLLVQLYPADHPRRKELLAELYAMKRMERPIFVAEQLETALFEGVRDRLAARRARKLREAIAVTNLNLVIRGIAKLEDNVQIGDLVVRRKDELNDPAENLRLLLGDVSSVKELQLTIEDQDGSSKTGDQ